MNDLLTGKNVIITGAARGIGRTVLELFVRSGANVWACARKPDTGFEEEIKTLADAHGVWIEPVYFDLSDEAAVKEGIQRIIREKKADRRAREQCRYRLWRVFHYDVYVEAPGSFPDQLFCTDTDNAARA